MFEREMGPLKEDYNFKAPGDIETEIYVNKEKRSEDQEARRSELIEIFKKKGLEDPEAISLFSEWVKISRDIVSEIEDKNEYAEKQIDLLVREAEIFADAGLENNNYDLINEALNRLEGIEETGYTDGVLFYAEQKANAGIVEEKIVKDVKAKIDKLKNNFKESVLRKAN